MHALSNYKETAQETGLINRLKMEFFFIGPIVSLVSNMVPISEKINIGFNDTCKITYF